MTHDISVSAEYESSYSVAEQPDFNLSINVSIDPHDHIGLLFKGASMVVSNSLKDTTLSARVCVNYYRAAQNNGALLEYGDLVNQGYVGLVQAAESYDPELGCRFSTYAIIRIITTSVRTVNNRINMPISMPINGFSDYINENRSLPTCIHNEYVPDELDDFDDDYRQLPQDELGLVPMYDEVEVKTDEAFEEIEDASFLKSLIANAGLSEYQLQLLNERYGLEDGVSHTRSEVAEARGVTYSAIQQMEKKALAKLGIAAKKLNLK